MRETSLALAVLLAGCAVGPDFKRPDAPVVTGYMPGAPPAQTVSAHTELGAALGFDQAAAQYNSTVIAAFQNVADALHALRSDADALAAAVAAEQAAASSLAIARKQLELGQVAYLALLNAEQAYQVARLALVQAQAARLSDTAGLFQALGGGWWNRVSQVAEK
jgi:outer membrane protein TolC